MRNARKTHLFGHSNFQIPITHYIIYIKAIVDHIYSLVVFNYTYTFYMFKTI